MTILGIIKKFSKRRLFWALVVVLAFLALSLPQAQQAQGIRVVDEVEPNNDFNTPQLLRRLPVVVRGGSLATDFVFAINLGGGFFEPLPDFYRVLARGGGGEELLLNLAFGASFAAPPTAGTGELQVFDPTTGLAGVTRFLPPVFPTICDFFAFLGAPICNSDLDLFLFQLQEGALILADFGLTGLPNDVELSVASIPDPITNFFVLIGDFGPALANVLGFQVEAATEVPYILRVETRGGGRVEEEEIVPLNTHVGRVKVAALTRAANTLKGSGLHVDEVYRLRLDHPGSVTVNLTSSAKKSGVIYLLDESGSQLLRASRGIRPEWSRTRAISLDAGEYLIGVRKPRASNAVYALTVSQAESGEVMAANVSVGARFYLQRKGISQDDLEEVRELYQDYLSQR